MTGTVASACAGLGVILLAIVARLEARQRRELAERVADLEAGLEGDLYRPRR